MLTVYADDSTDAKGERIFAVAGVMGTQEEWDELEIKWASRTGGKIFHATDCESGYGIYKNISREDRFKEYKDLTKIITNSRMMSFAAVVDIAGYRISYPNDLKDGAYFHCFLTTIIRFAKWTSRHIPRQTVKFIFDINHKVKYNAEYLYENYLLKWREFSNYAKYIDKELGFATSEKIGIQVADLISHEAMKHWDNIYYGANKRPIKKSMSELFSTCRFMWRFFDKKYFDDLEHRHEDGLRKYRQEYKNWLSKYRRQDNAESRTSYLIYLESLKD